MRYCADMVTSDCIPRSQLGRLFGVSTRTVFRLTKRHGLGFRLPGWKWWLFTPADVEKFAELRQATVAKHGSRGRRPGGRKQKASPTPQKLRARRHAEPVEFSEEYWR